MYEYSGDLFVLLHVVHKNGTVAHRKYHVNSRTVKRSETKVTESPDQSQSCTSSRIVNEQLT